MLEEIKIELTGIVQGVLLRKRVQGMAELLQLKGYVQNCADGSVLIIAQGKASALEELLSWVQRAPFPVRISGMSFEWREPSTIFSDFRVEKDKGFIEDHARSFMNLGKEVLHNKDNGLNIPNHVAIIPDGNRRWAKERKWHPWVGHRKAAQYERIRGLFDECKELGVHYLTFWAFSTENWKRDVKEVDEIMNMIRKGAIEMEKDFVKEEVRFRHFGRRDRLPKDVLEIIDNLTEKSKNFTKLNFQLCLDYNGRDDIVRAFNKMLADKVSDVDEDVVSTYLDSSGLPDPDLIIRTSGERRTSGIMAYQAAYAELYFTNVYFPDFDAEQFKRAVYDYSLRNRRFGGSTEEDPALKAELYDPDLEDNVNLAV